MKECLVTCVAHRWFYTKSKIPYPFGPKYNEIVTVIDLNIDEGGVVYFILAEHEAPDKIGWIASSFRKLVNDTESKMEEFEKDFCNSK